MSIEPLLEQSGNEYQIHLRQAVSAERLKDPESTLRVEIHGIAASICRHSLKSPEAAALRAWLPVVNESNTTGEAGW